MLANTQPSDTLQHLLDLLFFLNKYLLKIIYSFFFFFGCALAFSCCREWGLLSRCRCTGLVTVAALVAAHGLDGEWASVVVVRGLSCSAA